MSLNTIDTRKRYNEYVEAPDDVRDAINYGFNVLKNSLQRSGFRCANDDRAEELIAAIFHYLKESENLSR